MVLLPEPVTPASRTMPWSNLHRLDHDRRQVQPFEVGDPVVHAASDQAHVAHLLQQVDAEPPADAVDFHGVREVGPAGLVINLAVALVEHGNEQPHHFLVIDRAAVQRPQRAVDAHVGRAVDLQVQVAPFELDQRAKQLVDFQFLVLRTKFGFESILPSSIVVAIVLPPPCSRRSSAFDNVKFRSSASFLNPPKKADLQRRSRTGIPRSRMTRFVSSIVYSPK